MKSFYSADAVENSSVGETMSNLELASQEIVESVESNEINSWEEFDDVVTAAAFNYDLEPDDIETFKLKVLWDLDSVCPSKTLQWNMEYE